MVRRNLDMAADAKVKDATGHGRAHWFSLLDDAGAAAWAHKEMASFLVDRGVDGWWAQGITVAYEQERGLRKPGQRPDGSFGASVSKTLTASVEHLWPHLSEDARRHAWLDPAWEVTGLTEGTSVRLARGDGVRAVVSFYTPAKEAAAGKVRLGVG